MDERDKKPADIPGVVAPPPLILLAAVVLAWVLDYILPMAWLPAAGLANPLTWLGAAMMAGSLALAIWSIRLFRAARTNPEPWKPSKAIVASGPYRFTRNPMYLGMVLFLLGLSLAAGQEWGVVLTPVLWLAYDRLVVAREEKYLTKKFGAEYEALRTRTRRWL